MLVTSIDLNYDDCVILGDMKRVNISLSGQPDEG